MIKRNCYSEHLPRRVALSSQQTDLVYILVCTQLVLYSRGTVSSPWGSTQKECDFVSV